METHDKVMMAVTIILLISSVTFALSYFYLYGAYKQNTDSLKTCVDAYNNLSWQYYHNCTIPFLDDFKDNFNASYWYNNGNGRTYNGSGYDYQEFFPKCIIETKIIYHHTLMEGGMEYYQTCLRCSNLNQSIAPGILNNGEWMCPADTYY